MFWRLYYYCSRVKQGVSNFFHNIWVQRTALWNARSWDHSGLLYYLRNQLEDMEVNIRRHGHHTNKERGCDRMRVCIHILERLIKDEYDIERFNFIDDPNARFMEIRIEPKYTFPLNKLHARGSRQKQIDKDYLFYILNKYIDDWWD